MVLTRAQFLKGLATLPLLGTRPTATSASQADAKIYETDFVTGFEITDSGLAASGQPCWFSRFPYKQRKPNNGELGFYSDSNVFPAAPDPFPVEHGKRVLRSYRLDKMIECEGLPYRYAAALISSFGVVDIGVGNRIECRFALPDVMCKGYWPAFWLLPVNGSWPPEIDIMEWWFFNEGDKPNGFWNSQHHALTGAHVADQTTVSLPALGLSGDMTGFRTYAVELLAGDVVCSVDGRQISRRTNPLPDGRWYIVLNVAVAGDPWPGAPGMETRFPQSMVLEKLSISNI